MSTSAVPGTTPRVVVIALNYKLTTRVRSYVQDLADAGVDIDLLVAETGSTADADLDARVRVHRVLDVEVHDVLIRRIVRGVLFTFPTKAFGKARSMTVGRPALKKVDAGLALTRRTQSWVSRGIHKKLFWPTFRAVRPLILARRGRGPAMELDLAGADRIVAADQPAVPLAWRLARRYPGVRATTALDRKPYVGDK
ncbi:hypothetical protein [Couchioplanes caeruleus]|uniref:Uncharacterized protein n=2 Tax=Couchioplanes caeruleus TaxID=56438 RepID=A0A1K0GF52_9ACTN|nr:hypothetical protein [Couchioplanes caeruleus]OJF09468.1 hypothetical protein BG844_37295 [Couchioplanes caeruleus subsp. caeruleus]ROP31905.1 hypothetical protein EDD30_4832 [Couchioplanes caeruleus]